MNVKQVEINIGSLSQNPSSRKLDNISLVDFNNISTFEFDNFYSLSHYSRILVLSLRTAYDLMYAVNAKNMIADEESQMIKKNENIIPFSRSSSTLYLNEMSTLVQKRVDRLIRNIQMIDGLRIQSEIIFENMSTFKTYRDASSISMKNSISYHALRDLYMTSFARMLRMQIESRDSLKREYSTLNKYINHSDKNNLYFTQRRSTIL